MKKKFTFEGKIPSIICDTMPAFSRRQLAINAAYKAIRRHLKFVNQRSDNGEVVISDYQIVYIKGPDIFTKTLGFGSLSVRNVLSRSFHTAEQLLEQANTDVTFNDKCESEYERRLSLNFVLLHGENQADGSIRYEVIDMDYV